MPEPVGNPLFATGLTTAEMAAAVSDRAWLAAMLRFEAALATAQAGLGIIPEAAARAIREACDPARFDAATIGRDAVASASAAVPLVAALRSSLGDAGQYVHLGATSQDALDTAMMLVARDALDVLLAGLAGLGDACVGLAGRHRETPMLGRTLLQPALPVTFGYKAATWLHGVADAHRRLARVRREELCVQLGGPVGVGAEPRLVAALAAELGLREPALPWQTVRAPVVELGCAVAVAAGAAAKIAVDVILLSQAEVGELVVGDGGGSSSMAHKRNPARAVLARAAFAGAAAQAGVLTGALAGELERAAGAWQSEWPALTELLRLGGGAVARSSEVLAEIGVDADRMLANVERVAGPVDGRAVAYVDRAIQMHREEFGDG